MAKYSDSRGKGKWKVTVVPCGYIVSPKNKLADSGYDEDMIISFPCQAFLLQDGTMNILIDNGMNESMNAYGSNDGVNSYYATSVQFLESLGKIGLAPEDIDLLIYTHLHADHAGNAKYFPSTKTIVQRDEWIGCLNPCHREKMLRLYDPDTVLPLQNNPNLMLVDGDLDLMNEIRLIKTPGHTRGSQALAVNTTNGLRIFVGDQFHLPICCFPWIDTLMNYEGIELAVTPDPDSPAMPATLVMNYYDFYNSAEKIKALLPEEDPQYIICGHDAAVMYKGL
ncbi:MAG TPA: N-acyl homoserine lactonase family protein [Anaerovoracaceae bacterium]|nr:N-acyl homoserine lactonase family protein [Anaerovoracaceae bacterium]